MGFIKAVDFKGFNPNYWNVTTLADNKATGKTTVTLSLYKDKATRTATPAATIAALTFTLQGVDMKRAQIYPMLKTVNPDEMQGAQGIYFADAEDDNE